MDEDKREGGISGEELVVDKQKDFVGDADADKQELNEIKTEQVFGEKIEEEQRQAQPISEEQAKALLAEVQMDVEQGMAKADNHGKKIARVIIVALVVMAALGVGAWLLSGMFKREDEKGASGSGGSGVSLGAGNGDKDKQNEGTGESSKEELVELSVEDEVVGRLYGNFGTMYGNVGSSWFGLTKFYVDPEWMAGNIDKDAMLLIAISVLPEGGSCAGREDYEVPGDYGWNYEENGCYKGSDVTAKVEEIFGKTVALSDGDTAGGANCGRWLYNAEAEEFYSDALGCGGGAMPYIERKLERAEQVGDTIYLYEVAAVVVPTDEPYFFHVAKLNREGEFVGEEIGVLWKTEGETWEIIDVLEHRDDLDRFKWTFKKNADGNYVFEKLERV